MSAHAEVTIYCDGEECDQSCGVSESGSLTASGVRRYLRNYRWAVGLPGGRDFCPSCGTDQKAKEGKS
jgi:hypothetical protein